MNHVYRLKRSGRTQQLQPVPETARAAGKGSRTGKTLAQTVTATLASVALGGMASLAHAQQAPPAMTPPAVNQLPQGGMVTRGSAHINTSTTAAGNALMSVNQSSQRAVIDWASFNVGSQAKVQFNQPSSSAVTLNNILGNNASQIYGQISANGQVFLSNPNGVYFSPTAQVNVGGLVATTGKANADEFMTGKASFNRAGSTGSVVNQGQLTSAVGGYIALLAPEVRNQGLVIAQAGTVAMASGEAITLNFNNSGTGLAGITTTPQAIAALVENRSAVLAEGGQIILSAHALASLQGSVVKNSGQLSATSLSEKGGKIVLMADSIALTATSQITANGPQGGGTVLVGGDWQGSGDTRQALQVTMEQGASIEANATQKGDGGKVVLWSDVHKAGGLTQVEGRIDAKGAGTGNGGQVETSGHSLQVGSQTQVNTGGGEWLLDPSDITISSGTTSDIALASNTYTPTTGAATSVVNAATLVTNLASNNINITTTNTDSSGAGTGNITVSANLSWSSNKVLTLTAVGGISGSGDIAMTGAGGLVFNQAGDSTYAGKITANNFFNPTFTKMGAGSLTLTGAQSNYAVVNISQGTLKLGHANGLGSSGTGTVTVSAGATLDLNGKILASDKSLTISGTGVNGAGALINSGGNTTYSGLLTLAGNAFIDAGTSGISLRKTGTTITGSGFDLTLGGTNTSFCSVDGIIDIGTGVLIKQGTGSWRLKGNNTYTGGTRLEDGTLSLLSTNTLGSSGTIDFAGGTLGFFSDTTDYSSRFIASTGPYSISTESLSINVTLASNLNNTSLTNPNVGLIKKGVGTLTLTGDNRYSGGTILAAGTLNLSSANAIGDTSNLAYVGPITLSGGTMQFSANNNIDYSSRFATGVQQLYKFNTNGQNVTLATALTGTGTGEGASTLTKTGTGTLTLLGANTYTGTTTVSEGTLQVGNGTTTGSLAGAVSNTATLVLNRSDAPTWSNTITGSGATNIVAGSWILGGDNKLSGTSVLDVASGATLNLGNYTNSVAGLTGSGTVTGSTGALTFSNTGSTLSVFSGTFTNTGAMKLGKQGTGTQVLQGTSSTFSGTTTLTNGTLQLDSALALGTGTITFWTTITGGNTPTATLALNGVSLANPITTLQQAPTLNVGINTITSLSSTTPSSLTGTVNGRYGSIIFSTAANASLNLTNTLTTGTLTQKFTPASGGEVRLSGAVSGTGGLQQAGTGRLTLAGNNTGVSYTLSYVSGNTGTIRLAHNNALGAGNNDMTLPAGATLELGALDSSDLNITGKNLTLASSGTAAGGGFLHNVAGHNTWSGAINLNNNSVLTVDTGTSLNLTSTASTVPSGARTYFNLTDGDLTFGKLTGTSGSSTYVVSGAGTLGGALVDITEPAVIYARMYDATGLYTSVYGDTPVYSLGFYTASSGGNLVSLTGTDYSGTALFTGAPSNSSNAATYAVSYGSGITVSSPIYIFNGAGAATNWTVAPRTVTLSASKIYDGNRDLSAVVVGGLVGTQTLNVSGATANSSHVSANSSNYISALSLGDGSNGGLASNYALPILSHATAPVTINAATLIPTLTNTNITRAYDGTDLAPAFTPTATFAGLVAGDSGASITLGKTGATYNSKNVGAISISVTGLSISAISSAIGSESTDYQLSTTSGTLSAGVSISRKAVSLSALKIYDGTTDLSAAQVTVSTGVVGESLTVTTATASDAHVGTTGKYMTAATLADGVGGLVGNYQLPTMDVAHAPVTIQPKDLTVTLTNTGVTKMYDGTYAAPTGFLPTLSVSGALIGDLVGVSASSSSYNSKDVLLANTISSTGLSITQVLGGIPSGMGGMITPGGSGGPSASQWGSRISDYQLTSTVASTSASITTASMSISGITATNKVYDRTIGATVSTANVLKTGLIGSDQVTVSVTGSFVDKTADTGKTVNLFSTYGGADAGNYSITDQATTTADITKASLSVSGVAASNKAYNGNRTASLTGAATVTAMTGDVVAVDVTAVAALFADKNVGTTKPVTVSGFALAGTDAGNYEVIQPTGLHAEIFKAPLTVTATAVTKTYDGTTSAPGTGSVGTLAGSGDVVNVEGIQVFTDKNAGMGNKTVRASGVTIKDSLNADMTGNYEISYVDNTSSTINKAALTVTATSVTKTYDGTTSAAGTGSVGPLAGAGDVVNVAGIQAFTDKNAGTGNKTVRASGVSIKDVSDADTTGNYDINYVEHATSTIQKANATVTVNGATLTYNGANQTASGFTATGLVGGEVASVLAGVSATRTEKNAGTYTTTASGTDGNYNLTFVDGSMMINKALLTATGNSLQLRYSGTTQSVSGFTVSGLQGSDNVNGLTGISASGASGMNVGSYANTMTVADQPNYTVTGVSGMLYIGAAPITLISGTLQNAVSKVYDGTNVATLSASNYVLTGWLGSDLATVTKTTGTYDTANAGTNKTVTVDLSRGDYLASGSTDLLNYILPTKISGVMGQISKATVTPSVLASNKVYDTTVTANGAVSLAGVFSVDAAAASAVATSYSFADANVGQGKTVTASGISLGSGLTSNYELASTAATGMANITPAPLTVTAINSAKFVTRDDVTGYAGFAVTGLLNGQSPAAAGISAGVSVSRSNSATHTAGEYSGVLVPAGNAIIGNYAVSYVPGNYTIVPARQLLVQATSSNTAYGTAGSPVLASVSYLDDSNNNITNLTLSSQAVVGGNTVYTYADGASGTVSFSAAPAGTSLSAGGFVNVGSYGLAASNVSKTTSNLNTNTVTVSGNLTVQPLAVNVAATPGVTTYNSAAQTQATTSGLLGGDAVSIAGAVSQRNAGSYTSALSVSGNDAANYRVTYANSNYTINPAVLNATFAAADKVYDGNTTASLTSTDNRLGSDVLTVSATGRFADKNVGTAKPVTVSSVALSGADAANYTVNSTASTAAAITRLAQVTWVGGTTGSWFDPANWAGGAVPDLANVANVTIPAGVTVSFDNVAVLPAQAGPVNVDSLGTAGSLALSAGSLNVGMGGVTLNALTQTGGALATTGAVVLGSLSQSAGSLSAGSLSTTTAYSQSGTGTIAVTGDVAIAATAAPVVLGNLSTGGTLNVSSTGGSLTQTAGTVLTVTGPATFTASQGGAAADVTLDNAGNALNGPVTATGADVKLRTTGALTASVTAIGNATLTSGGSTTLGATTVGGDLQVTTANANVTQTGPVVVDGATTLNAGTGAVQLTDSGNRFAGAVSLTAASQSMTGAPDVAAEMDQAPQVLSRVVQVSLPYQVTLIQLPQGDASGQVHIEIQNAIGDVQLELPSALKNWIAAAGADVALENGSVSVLDGVHLTDNGATLNVRASVDRSIPLEFVIRAGREQVAVRIVWKS